MQRNKHLKPSSRNPNSSKFREEKGVVKKERREASDETELEDNKETEVESKEQLDNLEIKLTEQELKSIKRFEEQDKDNIYDDLFKDGQLNTAVALLIHEKAEEMAKAKAELEGSGYYGTEEIEEELEKLLIPILIKHKPKDQNAYQTLHALVDSWSPNTKGKYLVKCESVKFILHNTISKLEEYPAAYHELLHKQFSIQKIPITKENFSSILQSKIKKLNEEVVKLEKQIKSHKTSNVAYRFFHYPVNAYRRGEYELKGAKWAFLTALRLYMENPQNEQILLQNYRTLYRAGGIGSETGQILNAAIALGKLPSSVLHKFENIYKEELRKKLVEDEIIKDKSTSKRSSSTK